MCACMSMYACACVCVCVSEAGVYCLHSGKAVKYLLRIVLGEDSFTVKLFQNIFQVFGRICGQKIGQCLLQLHELKPFQMKDIFGHRHG